MTPPTDDASLDENGADVRQGESVLDFRWLYTLAEIVRDYVSDSKHRKTLRQAVLRQTAAEQKVRAVRREREANRYAIHLKGSVSYPDGLNEVEEGLDQKRMVVDLGVLRVPA